MLPFSYFNCDVCCALCCALCGIVWSFFLVWLFSWILAFVILLLMNLICNASGIPWCSGGLILARSHNLNQAIYTFYEQILSYSSGMKSALFRKCTECKESCRLHRACAGTLAHTEFVTPLWICIKRGGRFVCFSVIWYVICCPEGLASRQHSCHDRSFWLGCDSERDRLQCSQHRTKQTLWLPKWQVLAS